MTEYLSELGIANVGKAVERFDVAPQFEPFSKVDVILGEAHHGTAGNDTGRTLYVDNPWGTQTQANRIRSGIRAFQYQPYSAAKALLDPAAELGDGITVNGVYSGIYKMRKYFGSLMATDVEAPYDEEIDHEYPYEPKQDRVYKREIKEAKAQIAITATDIALEVSRATSAEEALGSRITLTESSITAAVTEEATRAGNAEAALQSSISLNATEIAAKVSSSGGSFSSFGWNLTDSSWTLSSNGQTVFTATSSGIEIVGSITATSGFIGNGENGFAISASNIHNGMTSLNDEDHNGVYIGTDGIALGKGAFKVTSSGSISANNMSLSGTLTIGGTAITANALRSGAQSAYNNSSKWTTGANWVSNNGNYVYNGASGGYAFSSMSAGSAYANYIQGKYGRFSADVQVGTQLSVGGAATFSSGYMYIGGSYCTLVSVSIDGSTYHLLGYAG